MKRWTGLAVMIVAVWWCSGWAVSAEEETTAGATVAAGMTADQLRKLESLEKAVKVIQDRLGTEDQKPNAFNNIEKRLDDLERKVQALERDMRQLESRVRRVETKK